MKKIIFLFVVFVMSLIFTISANAAKIVDNGECGLKGDNVTWTLDSDGVVIISGEGEMYYRDFYEGKYPAFYEDDRVEKVIIKNGVTTVAPAMFYKCKNLKSVILEGSIRLCEEAFSECESLGFVYVYSDFNGVEDSSFSANPTLNKIYLAPEATQASFNGLQRIKNVILSDGYAYKLVDGKASLVGIDTYEISGEVVLPEKIDGYELSTICEGTFDGSFVNKLTVPYTVTKLENKVFYGTTSLEEVILGKGITILPYAAFEACFNLKRVTLPDTITLFDTLITDISGIPGTEYDSNIGAQFKRCSSLEEIVLPSKLEYIPASTFSGCTALKKIVIPDSVKDFLQSFQIKFSNNFQDVTVTNVYSNTFSGCDSLESIVLSKNLKSLPSRTFYHCDNLTEVYIPGSVTEISEEAFKNCTKLESVIIGTDTQINPLSASFSLFPVAYAADEPQGLDIGIGAFENCTSLVFVSIDKSLTTIAENAFNDCGDITDIFYNGSEEEWNKIVFGSNNDSLLSARKHFNTESQYTHPFNSETVSLATCTKDGLLNCSCSCGYKFEVTLKAKGHNLDGAVEKITKEPTCSSEGVKVFYCVDCNEIANTHALLPLEHNPVRDFSPGSMEKSGYDITRCSLCDIVLSERILAKIDEIKVWDNLTCNKKGANPTFTVSVNGGLTSLGKEDYTVKYSSNGKKAGIFTLTITFKGFYEGSTTVKYKILPGVAENLKATPSANSVKLTWDKVYGASGYKIYKYDTKNKKYTLLSTISDKTTYTVKDLKAYTSYKFMVKAYGKSDLGTVVATGGASINVRTKLQTPTITSLTSPSKGKALIKWANIGSETGYQVYYSTSKSGEYKKLTTTKANKVSFTKSGLTKGKTYYFKVRAYKSVDGKTIYSKFSSIKSLKIK